MGTQISSHTARDACGPLRHGHSDIISHCPGCMCITEPWVPRYHLTLPGMHVYHLAIGTQISPHTAWDACVPLSHGPPDIISHCPGCMCINEPWVPQISSHTARDACVPLSHGHPDITSHCTGCMCSTEPWAPRYHLTLQGMHVFH